MVGTNQLEKAIEFYDELFAEIGIGRFMEEDSFVACGSADSSGFCVTNLMMEMLRRLATVLWQH